MTETMEQYMSKTRENYGSGVTRPTINQDTPFELKGQFLKELHDNTFSGSEHEDANEHIEKGVIPSKTAADAKVAIQEMAEYYQKSCKKEDLEACPALQKQILKTKSNRSQLLKLIFRISHIGCDPYAVSGTQHRSILSETALFPNRLQNFGCDNWREAQDEKILDAYDHTLPQKEKDLGRFTLPCFIHNICFDKALVDLGASVIVMSFSTYTNLGLGILSHTRLTIELADRTIKQPRGIAENVIVRIGKFIFPIDFIILDIPEDEDVPLILGRPFLSIAHSKIDVFKRKITLRVGKEKLIFKSIKPATSFAIKSLDSKTELIGEGDEPFDPTYGIYIELNDLYTPLQPERNRDVDFEPTFIKTDSYKMKFSCDKDEGKSHAGTLIDIPVFIGSFSIILGFTIIDDDDMTKDVDLAETMIWYMLTKTWGLNYLGIAEALVNTSCAPRPHDWTYYPEQNIGTPRGITWDGDACGVCKVLCEGASLSTDVEEGEPVETKTRASTLGTRRSTHGVEDGGCGTSPELSVPEVIS
ncbi:ribonuclease H-like domain-containing protein [Tanacetum coccineum]